MKEVGAPKEYPITHIAQQLGEDENFDEFVRKLCDEISETMEEREETLEPVWFDCEKNYWATGGPSTPKDSDLDFTITFETCKQASSNLSSSECRFRILEVENGCHWQSETLYQI